MDHHRYLETVARNREDTAFTTVSGETAGFDPVWAMADEDITIGAVSILATAVDAAGYTHADIHTDADRFRKLLTDRHPDRDEATTPLGYVVFVLADPDDSIVSAATGYTVANRRTNVFPLVYDTTSETLHTHPVPRLKGRGIYRRQVDDAEQLFTG